VTEFSTAWNPPVIDLYRNHRAGLVRIAERHTCTSANAEGIVHNAVERFARLDVKKIRNQLAYLKTMVKNGARADARRNRSRERKLAIVRTTIDAVQNDPYDVCRQLRYWDDRSEAEIANLLGVSHGTVKAHASRARSALRDELLDIAS